MNAHGGNTLRHSIAAPGKSKSGDQLSSSSRSLFRATLRTSLLYQNFSLHRLVGKLFILNQDIAELAEVMIEAGDWQIFSDGCGGDQAVHKMDLCSFEAVESF